MAAALGLKQASAPGGGVRVYERLEIGRIVNVEASHASISINKRVIRDNQLYQAQIGTILKILTRDSIVVAMVSKLEIGRVDDEGLNDGCLATLNILGEITTNPTTRQTKFFRGVRTFPVLGEAVYNMSPQELQIIFSKDGAESIEIGRLQQDNSIVANVRVDDMLSKHFAIIGSTGSGKSCTVALVLQAILDVSPAGHVVLFDPHNEYSKSFGNAAEVITGETLDLPIWLFDFVETVELLTSEIADHAHAEEEILHEVILKAKRLFERAQKNNDVSSQIKLDDVEAELQRATHITLDSPVPYRIGDVVKLLSHEMGKLENSSILAPYKRLKRRIMTLIADPRYSFIFRNQAMPLPIEQLMGRIFRLPVNGKPISILDFSSIPSETLNIVVSVISRLAFEVATWSNRQIPILLVCEEAHRYIPRDPSLGFHSTRRIISRIAKEGRKYGVSLGIISQRPSELEPSTLSQCSTIFSMRLSNELDQNFVRALNIERRAMQDDMLQQAVIIAERQSNRAVIVAAMEGWHAGIIGIVAGRLKDRFERPAIVIGIDYDGTAKGSGRSISGVDLGTAFAKAKSLGLVSSGGGHAMAGGLSLPSSGVEAFSDWIEENLQADVAAARARPVTYVDAVLAPSAVNLDLVDKIDAVGPYGSGNPAPLFVISDVRIAFAKRLKGGHIRFTAQGRGDARVSGILFRGDETPAGEALMAMGEARCHLLGRIKRNRYQGRESADFHLQDIVQID
jgi:DNA helicase HerA-like ATPase